MTDSIQPRDSGPALTGADSAAEEQILCSEFLRAAATARGADMGLLWRQTSFSYAQLADAAGDVQAALAAANGGTEPVRVGLAIPNCPVWLPTVQAAWDCGAQAVLISSALPPPVVVEMAVEQDLDVLVVPAASNQDDWAGWERGIVAVDDTLAPKSVRRTTSPGLRQPGPDGPGIVLFTSGTTGKAKPVPISNAKISRSMESTLAQFGARLSAARQNRAGRANVVAFPLYHISGLFLLLFSIGVQRPAALLEKFTVADFVDALERVAVSQVTLTPTMIRKLLDSPEERTVAAVGRLTSVRSGAAPLTEATRLAFEGRFGVPVLQGYGATETVGEIAGWTLRDRDRYGAAKAGSVGRPHPGTRVEIRDRAGAPAPSGEIGEIWVQGSTTGDSFIRTSDLGSLDQDGFLFLAGRGDDVINCGGFKILPAAVEQVIEQHPDVKECVVVGEPDDVLGEIPVAYVVARHRGLAAGQVLDHGRDHLAAYQCPRRVHLVDRLPRNELDKVVRRALSDPEVVAG